MAVITKPSKLNKTGKGKPGKPEKKGKPGKAAKREHVVTDTSLVEAARKGKPPSGWTVEATEGVNGAIRAKITLPSGTVYGMVGFAAAWGFCGGTTAQLAELMPKWGIPCRTSTLVRRVSAGSSAANGSQASESTGIGTIEAPSKADRNAIKALIG